MTKIKSLSIKGIRGIKEQLTLELDEKSILLYGDNGSGKSSITDTFEWFYNNEVEHLSDEEIGRRGLEALRNVFLEDEEEGTVDIEFTDDKYNSEKSIFYKKTSLKSEHSNETEEFKEYLIQAQKENLVLRYKGLVDFILATKREKLDTLSDIIGFSEVSKTRETLRKVVGELKREFKKSDFDNKINTQQQKIIDYFGRNITSDEQFVEAVNELIKPLEIEKKIKRIDEIDAVLDLIKKPEDSQIIELQSFYNKLADWASGVPAVLDEIEDLYKQYRDQFQKIIDDIEKINKIVLERLLTEGVRVIKENVVTDDQCPLCLQSKNKEELLTELENRILELQTFKKEKLKLDELRETLKKELREPVQKIGYYLSEKYLKTGKNRELAEEFKQLSVGFENYSSQLKVEILPSRELKAPGKIAIRRDRMNSVVQLCEKEIEGLKASQKDDLKFDVHSKVLLSREAYSRIKRLKKEKVILERQQQSFELIYSEFLKKQKETLESFLTRFSNDIDDLYRFMNPGEKVEGIKLIPLEKEDELVGITLEFKFFNNLESPPHKYLSESHLNCLGIVFFLTSVKAFNKKNKFFILDDVISSFDTTHRKRFADMLIAKFSDYQIILMTHEKDWFETVKSQVKGEDWLVETIKWDEENGSYTDKSLNA